MLNLENNTNPEKKKAEINIAESIDIFCKLKNDWQNEIPEEIKGSVGDDNKWKVRGAWFQAIRNEIKILQNSGI